MVKVKEEKNLPKHIVVLPDGNRRWARERRRDFRYGYQKGYQRLVDLTQWLVERKIPVLTVFGFSTENWRRPKDQVDYLMNLIEVTLKKNQKKFLKNGIRVRIIGERKALKKSLQKTINKVERLTRENNKIILNLAINYGGRWDIVQAIKKIIKSKLPLDKITEDLVNSLLSTENLPEPDLVIRTGGEKRLSNFLVWQTTYSELFFLNKHWPDFTEKDLDKILQEYQRRQRRFGGGK